MFPFEVLPALRTMTRARPMLLLRMRRWLRLLCGVLSPQDYEAQPGAGAIYYAQKDPGSAGWRYRGDCGCFHKLQGD